MSAVEGVQAAAEGPLLEVSGLVTRYPVPRSLYGTLRRQEQLHVHAVEGVDFSFDGAGNPVPTKQGSQDLNVPWKFAMAPPEALYNATSRDYAPVRHEQQAAILPLGIQNPTIGLYSKTDEAQGGALLLKMFDGINQIIFGQASLSTFDSLVGDWRRNGGDQMRGEYEQAIQASRA